MSPRSGTFSCSHSDGERRRRIVPSGAVGLLYVDSSQRAKRYAEVAGVFTCCSPNVSRPPGPGEPSSVRNS